jgi:hypothetical protein
MLKLSHVSTQCTHGAADSFAGIFNLVDLSKLNPPSTIDFGLGDSKMSCMLTLIGVRVRINEE